MKIGVGGGSSSDTFLSKNKGRTIDAFLSRWTTIIALGFFAFVIVINAIIFSHYRKFRPIMHVKTLVWHRAKRGFFIVKFLNPYSIV